ncbi:MAG: substrate-binding domain-containing protein [Acidobacteriota bacterium]|nr:substrate-binding domain-containing protein [Acidobacteriota bacterium]
MKKIPIFDADARLIGPSQSRDAKAAPDQGAGGADNRSVLRACAILQCFEHSCEDLGLARIVEQTGLNKATAYRLITTLVKAGMIERRSKNAYTLAERQRRRRTFRIGYASQTEEFSFSRLVSESIRSSAYEAGLELLVLDNRYSPTTAVRNAEIFVREHVDLVIEFQTNQESADTVASRLIDAAIPIIAIEIPHPGAFYYGANNYRAGLLAGRALAQACIKQWQGHFHELLLLELPIAGPLVRSRLTGIIAGLRELLPNASDEIIRFINGNGRFESSLDALRKYLRRRQTHRILIGAINDPSCLGALSAFEESGRAADCLAVSHNGAFEARQELRRPGSRLVGSVGYFPEQYGEVVIQLALDKLNGRPVPAATFVKHQLLNHKNVDVLYPNDALVHHGDSDSLLYSLR